MNVEGNFRDLLNFSGEPKPDGRDRTAQLAFADRRLASFGTVRLAVRASRVDGRPSLLCPLALHGPWSVSAAQWGQGGIQPQCSTDMQPACTVARHYMSDDSI